MTNQQERAMFTHSCLGTNDVEKSRAFYTAVMGALGYSATPLPNATVFPSETGSLIICKPGNGAPHTVSNGHTLGFAARDSVQVDAFHAAGLAHGGSDEGAPGIRPNGKYGAYLRDPDGNKICAFAPGAG